MTKSMQLIFGTNSIMGALGGFLMTRSWIGALIGLVVGAYFDGLQRRGRQQNSEGTGQQGSYGGYQSFQRSYSQQSVQAEFSKSLLILSAEVMKADGKILKSELDFVKQFLIQQFGTTHAQEYLFQLKEYLSASPDLQQSCARINQFLPPQQRSMLLQYLFGIAQSDGSVSEGELNVIERISRLLGIAEYEFAQLKAMFWKDASDAYKTLGLSTESSDQDVKKAYRKMAIEHHPDKVASLGEQYQKAAKEKFQKIQEAYEIIRKERGL